MVQYYCKQRAGEPVAPLFPSTEARQNADCKRLFLFSAADALMQKIQSCFAGCFKEKDMLPNPLFWNVHMYGIMVAVGILAAFLVIFKYGAKLSINEKFLDFIFYNGVASVIVGMGSAALFQAIYNFIENPSAGFHLDGGITFIGGLIGGSGFFLIIYFIFRKKLTGRLIEMLSVIPCSITVAHGFGRIGCFFAGCCYGKETDSFLGVKFPDLPAPVHPTQLYEAAFLFALFALCSYLVLKKGFRHNMSLYLVAYGIFRFAIEFLRGDDRGQLIGSISPSQFWSLLMVLGGVILYFALRPILQKAEKNTPTGGSAE